MKAAITTALAICFLAIANVAGAVSLLFEWNPGGTYPIGTTYDLQVNASTVTGITTNSYVWNNVGLGGTAITVRVRAVPPGGQGFTESAWLTVNGSVPYVTPSAPSGYKLIRFKIVP